MLCGYPIDNFQVYQGHVNDISSHNFSHVLRDPGCFYFFQVTSVSDLISSSPTPESTIIRRDLCWLTGIVISSFPTTKIC